MEHQHVSLNPPPNLDDGTTTSVHPMWTSGEQPLARSQIQDRHWAETLLLGENRVLELIAKGTPLPSTLDMVCRLVEELSGGCLCSVLLLDPDGHRLRHGAAPSLPKSYTDAIDGSAIGPTAGSCGTAAYRKELVIASDIATDPVWADYCNLAVAHGLRACWSTPIFASDGGVLGTFALYASAPGSPTRRQHSLIDQITPLVAVAIERARADERLRRSEGYLAEAQRLSGTGSFSWQPASGEITWSDETFRIYEYSPDVTPTLELARQRIHPDDLGLFEERLRYGPQAGKDFEFEHRLVMPGGAVKHVHVVARAVRDASGAIAEFLGAVMDVTVQRRAEQALRAAKARFEGILEIADDAIVSVDSDQRIVLFNHGAEKVFGYTAAEVMGEPLDRLLPQRFRHAHRHHIEAFAVSPELARSMGQRREVYGCRKDRSEFPAEASISKLHLGGEVVFTVILRDITERKRTVEELRRSEAYLAEAQRLSRTGSFGWRVVSGEVLWSKETFCILGYSAGTRPTLELAFQRVHPDDLAFVRKAVEHAARDGTDLDFAHRLQMPDGSVKHVHVVAHAVRDEGGALEFVGAVSDVTASKQAEERIRQDECELRQIVEAIPELILVLTPDGSPLYANARLLEYTGLTREDVQAGDFRERVFHPSDIERLRDARRDALARGVPFQMEQRARANDGRYRWFLIHYSPLPDERGRVLRWYATGTDIDGRKRMEERVERENFALREEVDKTSMFEEIVGTSQVLRTVLARVAKVAPTYSTVLVTGETGTGKELIARAIHKRSPRASRAFVSVNCAAVPPALISSELFGHEKGAFTGAQQRRLGRFELADGGTLFLDEIGELPSETQMALLRVLQEREFERVGGTRAIRVDVRVLAAANRDLQAAIASGAFRSDLFYRLSVFPIEMPPLRDRQDDISLLVEYFVDRYARKLGKKFRSISPKTLDLLQAYPWPGNIRELQNVIERSVIVCETETFSIDVSWLARETHPSSPTPPVLSKRSAAQERAMIEAALAETRGRVAGPSGAAAKLGLAPSTLESKIRTLKINKHRFKVA